MKTPDLEKQSVDSTHINLHSIDLRSLHNVQNILTESCKNRQTTNQNSVSYYDTTATAYYSEQPHLRYDATGFLNIEKNEAIDSATTNYHQYAKARPSGTEKS